MGNSFSLRTTPTIPVTETAKGAIADAASPSPTVDGARRAPPLFPVHTLPAWVRDYVSEVARTTSSSVELSGALALPTLGSCLTRKFVVQVTRRYDEPLVVWLAVFAPVAESKTPVLRLLSHPIVKWEGELAAAWRVQTNKIATERRVLERARRRLEVEASQFPNDAGRAPLLAEAQALAARIAGLQEGVEPQLIADDFTVEALVRILAEQDGRVALLSDEGAGLFGSILRRAGRGLENLDALLKSHSGSPIRVNRARGRVTVQDPALSLGLGLQPDAARLLRASTAFRGRGLLARFLWVRAPSMTGLRPAFGGEIYRAVEDTYNSNVRKMLQVPVPDGSKSPLGLTLAPRAQDRYATFVDRIEPDLCPGAPLHFMADWVTKQVRSGTIRVAGLLHCLQEFGREEESLSEFEIAEETMTSAIELMSYFVEQAKQFFEGLDRGVDNADVERLRGWILRRPEETFSRNEAVRAHQSMDGARVRVALQLLQDAGELTALEPPQGQPGRPVERYTRATAPSVTK